MGTTTTYDVMLRYRLDNKATADAEKLRHKLGEAHRGAGELGSVLAHIGMIAGGAMSIHGAWEHLVKFNSEVENAKISLAAMVEGGFGGSFDYAKGQAEALYKEFQKFSTQTPMTTQEMLEFSRGVAVSTQQAGGSIQDIVNITEQGAVAAKALGMESHYAARELSEMLSGNINNRMLFAKQLAGLGGKSTEDLRAMSGGERLEFLKRTLSSPAMKDAVSSMSTSFSGVTSTLIDKVQILLGKVGLPLFKAITSEVSHWNEWIDKNQDKIETFAHEVGGDLVTAFDTVKSVFAFIYDHSDVFLAIGKTWAAIKLGNMIGGGIGGMLSSGGLGGNISGLSGISRAIGPAAAAGLGGYELARAMGLDDVGKELGSSFYDLIHGTDNVGARFERLEAASNTLDQAFQRAADSAGGKSTSSGRLGAIGATAQSEADVISAYLKARSSSVLPTEDNGANANRLAEAKKVLEGMGVDTSKSDAELRQQMREDQANAARVSAKGDMAGLITGGFINAWTALGATEYQRQTLNSQRAMDEVFGEINRKLSAGGSIFDPALVGDILKTLRESTADPEGKHKAIVEKPKINVTIHRIEVQSEDPDRYAFRFVEAFRDHVKNPSQAIAVLREG